MSTRSTRTCLGLLLVASGACRGRPADERHVDHAVDRRSHADALAAAVRAGDFPRTTSVIAFQHGEPIHDAYFGDANADTLHDVRSVTKSVAALAMGIALADGTIPSVDAPAFAYLTDLRPFAYDGPAKQAITLAELLTMSSALDCDDDDPGSPGNEENMYPQRSWSRWAVDLPLRREDERDQDGRYPFAYCTAGVFLLGQILERATGQPVDRYVETRLFTPLGIDHVEWNRSPTGEVAVSGQLRIRTRDLAQLGLLVLNRGAHQGHRLVPAEWIDRMLTVQVRPSRATDPRGELGYGLLVWQRQYATPCGPMAGWYMSGNGGNHVVVLRELDAMAAVTTVNFNTRGMHDQTTRLLEEHVFPQLRCPG